MQRKIFLLISILFLFTPFARVNAQQLKGLSITPAIVTSNIKAGETSTYNLKIFSDVDRTIDVSIKALNKTSNLSQSVVGENIAPEFLEIFQNFSNQLFIKKDIENNYPLRIVMPEYFLGNYNFAIVFEESSPQVVDDENVAETSSQIAIPLIFNVVDKNGEIYENLSVTKYDVKPTLTFDGKNSLDISIKNDGTSYLVPRGVLSIKAVRILGSYQEQDVTVNSDKRIVLKDGTLDLSLNNNFEQNSIGEYKATLTVVYGLQNDIVTKEIYFWVFPPWFGAAVVLIAILLIYLIIRLLSKRKKLK